MGRPPCCDKVGIKKGPWTPEEDLILASYIQDHGPGNWRSVPTNTGLLRCSKSCRLRWTNYLRPGIKRGNFTELEEKTIISLQGLLGNKWAAIAAYLPQRTDNDIKNYWNTHLKKKLKKFHSVLHPHLASSTAFQIINKSGSSTSSYSERRNFDIYQTASSNVIIPKLNQSYSSSTYASSTENISRLLEGWMKPSPKVSGPTLIRSKQKGHDDDDHDDDEEKMHHHGNNCSNSTSSNISLDEKKDQDLVIKASQLCTHQVVIKKVEDEKESCDHLILDEEFESLLTFENVTNIGWEESSSDSILYRSEIHQTTTPIDEKIDSISEGHDDHHHQGLMETQQHPFSSLEKWLFDETTGEPLL